MLFLKFFPFRFLLFEDTIMLIKFLFKVDSLHFVLDSLIHQIIVSYFLFIKLVSHLWKCIIKFYNLIVLSL